MDLGKFTQIRPVQNGNTVELVKTHFSLEMPIDKEGFLETVGKISFTEVRLKARNYLEQTGVLSRADEILKFLDSEVEGIDDKLIGGIKIPTPRVLRFAYVLSWAAFETLLGQKGKPQLSVDGSDITKNDIADSRFSQQLVNDLIALYLVPGMLVEYRRFLSMLFKTMKLLEGLENGKEFFAEDSGTPPRLHRLQYGKILLPPSLQADPPPKTKPAPNTDGLIDPALVGQSQAQIGEYLIAPAYPAPKIDRPPIPGFGVDLTASGLSAPHVPAEPIEAAKTKKTGRIDSARRNTK